jgi:glycosyltransferase involved in cell wall biosynthesis
LEFFIREAVEGAFAQTYRPLEIVLCDDSSTDRTFELMRDMVARYCGSAKVVLHRNERNLGIVGNVNAAVACSSGELVVLAAGDDVSLPNRTEKLVRAWLQGDKSSDGIYSGYRRLNPDGELNVVPQSPPTLDTFIRQCTANVLGATAA